MTLLRSVSVVLGISVTKGVFGRDLILDSIIFDSVAGVIYCYGSGSGSFHQQAKKETRLDFYCFVTSYDFLPLKNVV
jgi:hypothetical protein